MAPIAELKARTRADYSFSLDYRTRWSDNDQYSHLNNSVYYFLFDSVVNTYLIQSCGLNPASSEQIGLVVHSHCDYFRPLSFPAVLELHLCVTKLGSSSVAYEIGVFEKGRADVCAVGGFVHVFVQREVRFVGAGSVSGSDVSSGTGMKGKMGIGLREGLQKLLRDPRYGGKAKL